MSAWVEFQCDRRGCWDAATYNDRDEAVKDSVEITKRHWDAETSIKTYLPDGWEAFGTETMFVYCPKHAKTGRAVVEEPHP